MNNVQEVIVSSNSMRLTDSLCWYVVGNSPLYVVAYLHVGTLPALLLHLKWTRERTSEKQGTFFCMF
jgi:hypothetical protein